MALMPGLQLNMGQQLKLTPQLQQSIKILQYSALEVQQTIATTLETNFMLDLDDEFAEQSLDDEPLSDGDDDEVEKEVDLETADKLDDDMQVDCEWEEVYTDVPVATRSTSLDSDYTAPENYTAAELSLTEKLYWQADTYPWPNPDNKEVPDQALLANYLIDEIDEEGYLKTPLEDIVESVKAHEPDVEVSIALLEQVLEVIWEFEPTGVGARDLSECLLLQLRPLSQTPYVVTARKIIEDHFDLLSVRDHKRLKKIYLLDDDELMEVIQVIQSLSPRPGRAYASTQNELVIPDLRLHRTASGYYMVELNQEAFPRLSINRAYVDMANNLQSQSGESKQIKEQLFEAKSLIKSIQSRGETLLRVGRYIVERQARFFEEGEQAMQPMVLRDLAEELDLHESTISRATNQKYMQTPRGTYELKYFFSTGVSQYGSDDQSAIAIKSHIKQLIESEDPKKPLSDNKLMQLLEDKDISVARRTIAKYREAMHIPSSSERKRMNQYR